MTILPHNVTTSLKRKGGGKGEGGGGEKFEGWR